ncbi:FAD/NAD(P)-binding domain-containing protein [Mycena venus]|uniref:FAD/NAD(P)-binding domain-containing protein n=1 Tax=Mycena venus TaxID=2733690 RepID=A0A8H6X9A3_9AGAR|nr:FAD/NAD(P)-binding domain-containing protein [Mycena venus]
MARVQYSSPRPLQVSIVGAGIAGLAAAISLRRSGHRVTVFEASQLNTEVDAGLSLQANAVRILEQFGCFKENLRAVDFDGVTTFDAKNGVGTPHPWLFPRVGQDLCCHRDDLHNELKRLAFGDGEGPSVQLWLDSKILACDPEEGAIFLGNSEIIYADVVIGADGTHSVVRTCVLRQPVMPVETNWACFRCLFDAPNRSEFVDLAWLTKGLNGARSVRMRENPLRQFFVYPVRNGTLLNFVGFYPESRRHQSVRTSPLTLEDIRQKFYDFHPKFLRILDLPLHSPILKLQLKALPQLPTWIRGRTTLLGDAAHSSLPMLSQGAAMAIEEAAALGCLLPVGTSREDVPARLEAYQTLRKARGEHASTSSMSQSTGPEKRGLYNRSQEMEASLIDHDTIKVTQAYVDAQFGSTPSNRSLS